MFINSYDITLYFIKNICQDNLVSNYFSYSTRFIYLPLTILSISIKIDNGNISSLECGVCASSNNTR